MSIDPTDFGRSKIRFYRKLSGMTLGELALRAGCTRSQIHKLERGERRLTVDWMERIAEALGCKPYQLMPSFPITPIGFEGLDEHAEEELESVVWVYRDQARLALRAYRYWKRRSQQALSFSYAKSYEGFYLKDQAKATLRVYRAAQHELSVMRRASRFRALAQAG